MGVQLLLLQFPAELVPRLVSTSAQGQRAATTPRFLIPVTLTKRVARIALIWLRRSVYVERNRSNQSPVGEMLSLVEPNVAGNFPAVLIFAVKYATRVGNATSHASSNAESQNQSVGMHV